ncbi:hypothetical protein PLESTB_000830600 [Pleodorina starrii]|uniref:Uncharacterized protein n=1 Tax=Pleodorina starrii TaxID=330485 RepID=A0A9W6F2W8_9CHLO|nr:hypothetical protein PLESTB_000830600 [Pleodorina starrii]
MYLPDQWPESRLDEWLERRNAQGLGGPHRSYIDKLAAVLDRDRDLTGAKPLDWTCGASFTGRRLSGEDAVDMVCEELAGERRGGRGAPPQLLPPAPPLGSPPAPPPGHPALPRHPYPPLPYPPHLFPPPQYPPPQQHPHFFQHAGPYQHHHHSHHHPRTPAYPPQQ